MILTKNKVKPFYLRRFKLKIIVIIIIIISLLKSLAILC